MFDEKENLHNTGCVFDEKENEREVPEALRAIRGVKKGGNWWEMSMLFARFSLDNQCQSGRMREW